jgi:hypothetical protein
VGGAVLGWAEPGSASHLGAEVGGCPEAAAVGDQVEGRDSLFDEAASEVGALGGEPRQRRGAQLGAKSPVQRGGTEVSVTGEVGDRQRRVEPCPGPLQGL